MKKSLLAVAAIGAFASAAQAQSSVTVYGILDVGYVGNSASGPATTGAIQGNGPSTQKVTNSSFGQSAEQSSRIGFKGTEDLGGGTSAFFTAEFGLQPQGTTWAPNNRQSFVGLKKNGIGQASIGTQYTALWMNALNPTDPGNGNNVAGNIIRPVGLSASQDGQGAASTAVTILTTNSLYGETARFAGFRLAANYVMNGQDATQRTTAAVATTPATATTNGKVGSAAAVTGGPNTFTGVSFSGDYTLNKLLVTAAYSNFKQQQIQGAAGTFDPALAFPSTAVTVASTTNTSDTQYYGGATYDFGILKAYANYVNRKIVDANNSSKYLSRSGQQIGVRSYVTPVIEAWASAGLGRYQAFGAGEPTANVTAYQLGANYYLSKRTNLYGIFGHSQTSSVNGSSIVGATAGSSISGYALGLRHTF
ncbi:porin [Polynucleobacter brandtiae]|uniref:Putative porin n=1 Tax=Polynucleobacter brandtiae TaxID=1938816 RepID=A0A2M8VRK7_9BURK|nr:porin [Polynucleobacter brandtiae]PJI80109.1 putative porin [Polynucleobacter brandtiae]